MPWVVRSAVRAPLPSSSALVTTVVAWASSETSAGRTPCARVGGGERVQHALSEVARVVGTFTTSRVPRASSATTTSVKVPPMSTPMRQLMGLALLHLRQPRRDPGQPGEAAREPLAEAGGVQHGQDRATPPTSAAVRFSATRTSPRMHARAS